MERGSPLESFAMSDKRVSSPKAAKTIACACRLEATVLRRLRDIVRDILHLLRPAAIIHTKRFCPPVAGNLVEARLDERHENQHQTEEAARADWSLEGGRDRNATVVSLG